MPQYSLTLNHSLGNIPHQLALPLISSQEGTVAEAKKPTEAIREKQNPINETGATKYILCTKEVIVHISTVIDIFAAPLVLIVLGH